MRRDKIERIVALVRLGKSTAEICDDTGLTLKYVQQTIRSKKISGELPGTIRRKGGAISAEARSSALDDWCSALYTLAEIAQRHGVGSMQNVKAIVERGRIDGDARAISSEERLEKQATIRKQAERSLSAKGPSLAEQIGIKIGRTIVKYNVSLGNHAVTPRKNFITLSGGLVEPASAYV